MVNGGKNMVASNSVLNEYYSQTKGSNIMFNSDDFWLGAWFGSMLGGDSGNSGGGCYTCLCCVGCVGCIACFTGNLGAWLCGVKDFACGSCSLCCSCCDVGSGYDAGKAGGDQCCDGLCNMFCF